MMRSKSNKGFTLIELLIVVAIIGIIAAIAIPNLLSAIQRGRQKRTMADARSVGTSVETYAIDNGFIPRVTGGTVTAKLSPYLSPTFIKTLPRLDGWKQNYGWVHASVGVQEYTVFSGGADSSGTAAATTIACTVDKTTVAFDCDICFSNGQFTQWPEGTQT